MNSTSSAGRALLVLLGLQVGARAEGPASLLQRGAPGLSEGGRPLLDEVAEALGDAGGDYRSAAQKHLPQFEKALSPTLAALPRNSRGRFDPPVVRYALHRLFLQQRAWRIAGLDPEGTAWNSSSPAEVEILEQMPTAARATLASRLAGRGLDAHEVAVLAATVEHLIHDEAAARLRATYRALRFPLDGNSTKQQVLQAVDLYMASYILGKDILKTPRAKMLAMYAKIDQIYPAWNETQRFIWESLATQGLLASKPDVDLGLVQVTRAVEDISDRHGPWSNYECKHLKEHLVSIEDRGTGRVRLADFYGDALGGKWQFQESVPYLRQLGALDESNPGNLRVIIPNYVSGLSNCVGASDFHSVCCVSECEELLGHVEQGLRAPEALPEDILALVAALPSATLPANHSIPELLALRLKRIAAEHGGRVPIHGRLFAQWLHHVYPRECPYPHLAGSTSPMNVYDWAEAGRELLASDKEMRRHASVPRRRESPVEHAPWVHLEELVGDHAAGMAGVPPPVWLAWGEVLHGVAALAAFLSIGFGLFRLTLLGKRVSFQRSLGKPQKLCPDRDGLIIV